MPISTFADIETVISIISADNLITETLEFSPSSIFNTSTTDELILAGNRQIFVYYAPSKNVMSNRSAIAPQIQIDVSAPINQAGRAMKAIDRIIRLFERCEINKNGSLLTLVAPSPCEMACVSGFYTVAVRFSYNAMK